MKDSLLEELMKISPDAATATVQGVEMQVIDENQAQMMLAADNNDESVHECRLANGRFLFETERHVLKALFKVRK